MNSNWRGCLVSTSDEIYRAVTAAQERFAFFFLAAAGGSIAFALGRIEGPGFALWMGVAWLAVGAWGASFFYGAHHLLHRTSLLLLNFQRQKVVDGNEPQLQGRPVEVAQAILNEMDKRAKARQAQSGRAANLQFGLFFAGAVLFIIAHMWKVLRP
jgi:hypothetical protein